MLVFKDCGFIIKLIKRNKKFKWTLKEEEIFFTLKKMFIKRLILMMFILIKKIVVKIDVSKIILSVILIWLNNER